MRINRSSDDAAGLAISSTLNANARLYSQAIRNANDGLSILSIAEGNIRELSNVVTRISELAEQSANGVYSTIQRQALDREAQSLANEFNRIIATATYNNKPLLSAATNELDLQVGITASADSRIKVNLNAPVVTYIGDGTVQSELSNTYAGISLDVIAIGDLNNDGRYDVVSSSNTGEVSVMIGNGNGTFNAAVSYNGGYGASERNIILQDVNNDGNLDYIGANFNLGFATVMLGTSTGSFGAGVSYAISSGGSATTGLVSGDFNGDGRIDLATVDTGTDKLNIILNSGGGTFSGPVSYALPGGSADEIVVGYINNDSVLDIAIETGAGSLQVMFGNSNGTFSVGGAFNITTAARSVILQDVNGDGYGDFIGGNGGTAIGVLLSNGDGTFKAESAYTTPNQGFARTGITVGDFNSDGKGDLAVSGLGSNNIAILLSNGDGTFRASTNYSASSGGQTIAVGDFNNDTVSDVALGGFSSGHLGIYITNASAVGGLPVFSLQSASSSLAALDKMKTALDSINKSLGNIGAAQSRLKTAINNAFVARENFLSASNRIVDANIAEEASNMIRLSILQQTSSAILAQANQLPKLVLDLIKT
jgi:flagellin-like hook-associated protein FlgL